MVTSSSGMEVAELCRLRFGRRLYVVWPLLRLSVERARCLKLAAAMLMNSSILLSLSSVALCAVCSRLKWFNWSVLLLSSAAPILGVMEAT